MTKELQAEVDQAESDHELILLLKTEVEKLTTEIEKTEQHLEDSLSEHHETAEQLALHEKLSAQQTLLKHVFYGVISPYPTVVKVATAHHIEAKMLENLSGCTSFSAK